MPRSQCAAGAGPAALAFVAGAFLCAAPASPAPGEAARWGEIGTLRGEGRLDEALEALHALSGEADGDTMRLAETEHDLLHRLGRYPEALAAAARWRTLAGALGDPRQRALAALALGATHLATHDAAEAEEALSAAAEEIGSADAELETRILLRLAEAECLLARYGKAEERLRRAESLLPTRPSAATEYEVASAWAILAFYRGDLLATVEHRTRSMEAARRSGEPARLAAALTGLGQAEIQIHDYSAAVGHLREALELDLGGPRQRAVGLAYLAIAHLELGQLAEAEEELERALRAADEAGSARLRGFALGELGLVAWKRRQAEKAMDLFARAVEISHAENDPRNEVIWRMNAGMVLRDLDRCEEALVHYRRAEEVARNLEGHTFPTLAKHIGQCEAALGRSDEALELLERAVAQATVAGDQKVIWEAHRELARVFVGLDRLGEAEASYLQALAAIEEIRGALKLPAFKTDFFEDKVEVFHEVAGFLAGQGDVESSLSVAERSKARAFLDIAAEARLPLHELLPAPVLAREREILDSISGLQRELRGDPASAAASALEALESDLAALQLQARTLHPAFAALRHPEPASAEDIRAALTPEETLLVYQLGEPRSHLWIVTRSDVRFAAVPGRAEIEAAVRLAVGDLIVRPAAASSGGAASLEELGTMLLGPLGELGPDVHLLVVPDGILHYLPFEVLPVGGAPLTERATTSTLPSATWLARRRSRLATSPTRSSAPALLAIGDPELGLDAAAERNATLPGIAELGRLPASRREVEDVAAVFGRSSTTLLLGGRATEAELRRAELERRSVLHFATHGWVDPGSAARSGLVLALDAAGETDGILQVREIFSLPLACDLVVLSACRSALGELVTGEGMTGLTRAFLHAGSEGVVATLWNVDDAASAAFMKAFYSELEEGLTAAEALREARASLRRREAWSHPYYWAPYILVGDPEQAVRFPPRSPLPWTVLWSLPIVALLAWLLGRRRDRPELREADR